MRQYIASNLPDKNGQLSITGKDFKYLCQVLRLSVGDVIQVRLPNQELVNMQVFK
jgi:16S rRNA (uracil1498-N3)-methyltransferase